MNRLGEFDEVAQAVVWLLCGQASFVNGDALLICGGDTRGFTEDVCDMAGMGTSLRP